jgi:hypothetical protein
MGTVYLRLVILSKSVFHFDKKGLEPNRGRLHKQRYSFLTKSKNLECLGVRCSNCVLDIYYLPVMSKKVHLMEYFVRSS